MKTLGITEIHQLWTIYRGDSDSVREVTGGNQN